MNNLNDIFNAIYDNDIDRVQILINNGIDINAKNEEGNTPLIVAAKDDREDIVLLLLDSGANIDETDDDGDTALMNLARDGNRENIIQILLDRGSNINLQNERGYSAIMLAALFNPDKISTLQTFIDSGADIYSRDNEGNTVFELCIMEDNEDLIHFLLENGSDINSQNNVGDTPLIIAVYIGFMSIVQILVNEGANMNLQNYNLQTPLHVALEYERELVAQSLCSDIDLEIDIKDNEGKTPLMYACEWGFLIVARILLERGSDPYLVDNNNYNSFYFANLSGNLEIIELLSEYRDFNMETDEDEDEEEDFDFEEAEDINENNFTFDTCKDLILDENVNIVEHLNETDTFLFINGNPSQIGASILCFDKNTIRQFLENKNDNWFYECDGPFLTETDPITGEEIVTNDRSMRSIVNFPYIKIFLNEEGLTGFVPLIQIRKLLSSNHKVYYIYPMIENGTQKMISHTVSWQNAYGPPGNVDYYGANHCQSGSNILIYTLKVCRDPERCVRSIFV
jgi:ankyrin repeat protein